MTSHDASTPHTGISLRVRRVHGRLLGGILAALAALAISGVASPAPSHAGAAQPPLVLAFQTMIGNSGPYVGAAGTLRNMPAGGAPWKISSAAGTLRTNGQLIIVVRGLTLLNGVNPVPQFEGAVSCQSISAGAATVANVFTPPFPATTTGNSLISATVTLPTPCFAPIVFVTSPAPQSWFATTGM
jgi:hypothetical protein